MNTPTGLPAPLCRAANDQADVSGAIKWPRILEFNTLCWTAGLRDLRQGMDPEWLRLKLGLSERQWKETLALLKRLAV